MNFNSSMANFISQAIIRISKSLFCNLIEDRPHEGGEGGDRDPGDPAGDPGNEDPPNAGDYGEQTGAVKDEALFLAQFMGLSEHVRKLIGHDFSDFIKMCTFRGASCLDTK